ncbi:MAG: signal peptide peptidase SppA [Myxococcales bacterium]|nr:signal peptide peptidase SppA [Myxococcales bacterium]
MKRRAVVTITWAVMVGAAPAWAQVAPGRYADDSTRGVELPATPLAGDQDARATVVNPGGLYFLDGQSVVGVISGAGAENAVALGPGLGAFAATPLGGRFLPRFAVAAGLEVGLPARAAVAPDPGTPVRATVAAAYAPWAGWGVGLAWHRFFGDSVAAGTSTVDVGVANRWGNHLAFGAVARDLNAPRVAGAAIHRRFEAELGVRPLGSDRLEIGLGGVVAEPAGRRDVDAGGWLRLSAKVVPGVFVEATGESRALTRLVTTGTGEVRAEAERDVRLTAGLSVTFGQVGVAAYGSARVGDGVVAPGGALVARWSERPGPSVLGAGARLERIELSGAQSARAIVATALRLRAIARDPDVRGVILAIDGVGAGWASLEELRREVARVRARGKKVFAYLVGATARDYWLACAADKIYLDPGGGVRLIGFAGTTLYLKGLFDHLGVRAQFEKIAEYKSAPEQYTEVGATEAAARMRDALYDGMWATFVDGIAASRGLSPDVVRELVDGGPYSAGQLADDHRLIDAVGDPERVVELIAHELGGLAPLGVAPRVRDDRWQRPGVAIIYADGDIIDGPSRTIPVLGRKLVGGETLAGLIAAARASPAVAAIVLRIDSPGGSALASELMAREVFATRKVKPIICSMGDVAASGGYFLAAGCDQILASETTITGSIGIFYGKFDLSGLMAKLGVTTETFRRGARADMESYFRPYTEEERAVLLDRLRYFYGRFTDAVSRGRGLTVARVDELGRGHVWTGRQARAIGLVDQIGGITDAIELAKVRAGLGADARVRIIELPRSSPGLLGAVAGLLGVSAATEPSVLDLPIVRAALTAVPPAVLITPGGAQARLPFDVVWE